jgi:hypothetical protein
MIATTEQIEARLLDVSDAKWFVDKYVTVREDGTPVLTVQAGEFEAMVVDLLRKNRREVSDMWASNYIPDTGEWDFDL